MNKYAVSFSLRHKYDSLLQYSKAEVFPMLTRSKEWDCGRSLAGTVDSILAGNTDVCLL